MSTPIGITASKAACFGFALSEGVSDFPVRSDVADPIRSEALALACVCDAAISLQF